MNISHKHPCDDCIVIFWCSMCDIYIYSMLTLRNGPEKRKKWLQPMKEKWILFVVRVTVSYADVQHTKHTSRTVEKMPVSSTSTTSCWCPSSLSSHTPVWYSAYSLQTSTHITSQQRNAIYMPQIEEGPDIQVNSCCCFYPHNKLGETRVWLFQVEDQAPPSKS